MRAVYEPFHAIHPAMFGQAVVKRMYRPLELRTLVRSTCPTSHGELKLHAIGGPSDSDLLVFRYILSTPSLTRAHGVSLPV